MTEWCPGGAWAIFMALNCRKDLPRVTRQNNICLHVTESTNKYESSEPSAGGLSTLLVKAAVPVADVTGAVFVCGAAGASADAVHILIAFG